MAKKVEPQMKAPFFSPSSLISIIAFLANLKLARNTQRIREGATMWILFTFVKSTLASTLNSCTSADTSIAPAVVSAHQAKPLREKKLERSYSKVVYNFHTNFASDQAIARMKSTISQYI